jgi:hypothetical protein
VRPTSLAPMHPASTAGEAAIELPTGGDRLLVARPARRRPRSQVQAGGDRRGGHRPRPRSRRGRRPSARRSPTFKGDAWFLGTPKGRNFFHQLFARASGRPRLAGVAAADDGEPEHRPGRNRGGPAGHAAESAFNQEFLGIPADDGGNPFGLAAIRRVRRDGSRTARPSLGRRPRQEPRLDGRVRVERRPGVRWTGGRAIGGRRGGRCRPHRRHAGLIDSTGVGDPIVETLAREPRTPRGSSSRRRASSRSWRGWPRPSSGARWLDSPNHLRRRLRLVDAHRVASTTIPPRPMSRPSPTRPSSATSTAPPGSRGPTGAPTRRPRRSIRGGACGSIPCAYSHTRCACCPCSPDRGRRPSAPMSLRNPPGPSPRYRRARVRRWWTRRKRSGGSWSMTSTKRFGRTCTRATSA